MRRSSRKITYSALLTAISVCCMLIAQLLPVRMPLFVCSICYFIALERCGVAYGFLTIIVSVLLMLMVYVGTAVMVAVIFVPYGIIEFLIRRLTYKKAWHVAVRVVISAVFANIILLLFYFLAHIIMPEINLERVLELVGGYFVLAIFATLFFIATDFFFREFCIMFGRLLKPI